MKLQENSKSIKLIGGMSAEAVFAKVIASKKSKVFDRWIPEQIQPSLTFIKDSIENIVNHTLEITLNEKTIIISPGILTIPYIVELGDFFYLPSQFLICVNNINHLNSIIENAQSQGIDCYAEIGIDECIPNCLVGWIKFRTLPPAYINLLNKLKTENILVVCVNNVKGGEGENISRKYSENISFVYIFEGYGMATVEQENNRFKELCPDLNINQIQSKVINIQDWESGIVDPVKMTSNFHGKSYHLCFKNSQDIYDLSFKLSKQFIYMNKINFNGYVLNPYFVNNPLFEAFHGYIAYSYWQSNENAVNHFYELTGDPMKRDSAYPPQFYSTIWNNGFINIPSTFSFTDDTRLKILTPINKKGLKFLSLKQIIEMDH